MATTDAKSAKKLGKRSCPKAEHGTSVNSAFHRIRDLIVHGRLAPGSWIVEGDLCEYLQMSRTPVRRAAALPAGQRRKLAVQLRSINQQLEQIAQNHGEQRPDIFTLDHEFHLLLVEAGSGARLSALHRAIEPQTERYWRLYASSIVGELHTTALEHEEIVDALIAGDAERLEQALIVNWEKGSERLAKVIELFGERGSW